MRTGKLAVLVAGFAIVCAAAPAHADRRSDVAAKARAAMASYDAMDYEAAKKQLYQALAIAKKAKLDKDPVVARVYLDLGILQLAASDHDAAKLALLSAVQIDPKITIDPAYKSPELVKLLDEARLLAAGLDGATDAGAGVDCKAIRGVQHTPVETGKRGAAQPVEAWTGADIAPARVSVMYRPEGAVDFVEARAIRQGCKYVAAIPAAATSGSVVHYYIAAYDTAGRVLAAKGSSGAPNVLAIDPTGEGAIPAGRTNPLRSTPSIGEHRAGPAAVTATAPAAPDDGENPLADGARDAPPDLAAASARAPHRLMIAVAGGSGVGYVTGRTERNYEVQSCCLGTSLVALTAEVGYHVTPRVTLGVAGRIGFPIGANIPGHSTVAPAGFLRLRFRPSGAASGLGILAEVGGGILRNTLEVDDDDGPPGMTVTDIVAQGPLLLGAGIGYLQRLSSTLAIFIDLEAIAGIAVVDQIGSAIHLNTGISADMKLGLAVGF